MIKYCKYCGNTIDPDSIFCSSCGAKIKSESDTSVETHIESEETKTNFKYNQVEKHGTLKVEPDFLSFLSKKVIVAYVVWGILNLTFLFLTWGGEPENFILISFDLTDYDFTEFVFFMILPILVYYIRYNLNDEKDWLNTAKFTNNKLFDYSYPKVSLARDTGYALIVIHFAVLLITYFNPDLIQSTIFYHIYFVLVAFVIRIIAMIWIGNITNKLNRKAIGWRLFAFFLPAIALLVIGYMSKYKDFKELPPDLISDVKLEKVDDYFNSGNTADLAYLVTFSTSETGFFFLNQEKGYFYLKQSSKIYKYQDKESCIEQLHLFLKNR